MDSSARWTMGPVEPRLSFHEVVALEAHAYRARRTEIADFLADELTPSPA